MSALVTRTRDVVNVFHGESVNADRFPSSWGKSPTRTRLAVKHTTLPIITANPTFHGVNYVRTAKLCIEAVTPDETQNQRCIAIARSIEISPGTVENILNMTSNSIKAEYLMPLIALVRITGRDPFAIRGVSEVHAFIFGDVK